MDGGAWKAAVHGIAEGWARLSDFIFTFHFHALEKEMATHSSVLAWRIPGTGEPGGLPSLGSHRLGHDWSNLAVAAYYINSDRGVFKISCEVFPKVSCEWVSEWMSEIDQLCPILWPHGLKLNRLLHPWDSTGKNTGVGYHFLFQAIIPTQGLNLGFPHWRQML